MPRLVVLLVIASLSQCGCHVLTKDRTGDWPEIPEYSRHFDEAHARHVAEKRALNALGRCYPHAESEFKYGFVQAYVDIALGGDGRMPALPPERFWSSCRRDPDGYCEASHWYAGYSAGAQRALGSCWNAYNVVPAGGISGAGGYCGEGACGW